MSGEYLGDFAGTETMVVVFDSFNSNGASVTLTGLATTGIEIYKGSSTTQRSSDSGYALIDTDGIDVDSTTGVHGFTVDLSDNTDAGFFATGNDYYIVVNGLTIDSQSVSFIAARFSIQNRYMRGTDSAYTDTPPTVAQIRAEMDSNSTQLAAIVADTNELQTDLADGGRVDVLIDGIKAKTDSLTFTVANQVDCNVQYINDVQITGDGGTGTEFGV